MGRRAGLGERQDRAGVGGVELRNGKSGESRDRDCYE